MSLFIEGMMAASLLRSQREVVYESCASLPLTKEQALLYMGSDEYKDYLSGSVATKLFYITQENTRRNFCWIDSETLELHLPTTTEYKRYRDHLEKELREQHLHTLQINGIRDLPGKGNDVPSYKMIWHEKTTADKVRCVMWLICCPIVSLFSCCSTPF